MAFSVMKPMLHEIMKIFKSSKKITSFQSSHDILMKFNNVSPNGIVRKSRILMQMK